MKELQHIVTSSVCQCFLFFFVQYIAVVQAHGNFVNYDREKEKRNENLTCKRQRKKHGNVRLFIFEIL